jgi:hypothetical protein
MLEFLPKEIQEGLRIAEKRKARASSRMSVHVNDDAFPILRWWGTGFAIEAHRAPHLRGLVNIYDGPRHILQCLIVATTAEHGVVTYEFKRSTRATQTAALDFYQEVPEQGGYLPRPS